jgi:hypothetical protein
MDALVDPSNLGWWGVPLAVLGGAVRVGTPLLLLMWGALSFLLVWQYNL